MKVDVSRRITDKQAISVSDTIANTFSFRLKDGFVIDGTPGFTLHPYDEVYVRTSPGFSAQKNVIVEGEVLFGGTYTLTNIDPYHKFEYLSQSEQTDILCGQIREGIAAHGGKGPLLILAPETFTNDVFLMDGRLGSVTVERLNSEIRGCGDVSLIVGASSYEYISSKTKPSPTARRLRDGMWVESHNSALLLDGKSEPQIYHKSKLVVAVEMTPYPKLFCKIDDMLGGVMGRC